MSSGFQLIELYAFFRLYWLNIKTTHRFSTLVIQKIFGLRGTSKNSHFFVRVRTEVALGIFLHFLHLWRSSTAQMTEWIQEQKNGGAASAEQVHF